MTAKRKKEGKREKCFPSPAWELAGVRGRGVSQAQKTRRMGGLFRVQKASSALFLPRSRK